MPSNRISSPSDLQGFLKQPRRFRFVRLILVAWVFVSILIPATRELHILTVRLLLHVQTDKTTVRGYTPSCTVEFFPTVHFTEQFKLKCLASSSESPDSYILAMHLKHPYIWDRPLDLPELKSWEDHPLRSWVALATAVDVCANESGSRNPSVSSNHIVQALEVVHGAQEAQPENGALWLAEALIHFDQGSQATAVQALENAADRWKWDSQSVEAASYRNRLMQREGLPLFDAPMASNCVISEVCLRIIRQTGNGLFELMSAAVENNDREGFLSTAQLLRLLHDGRWKNPRIWNGFRLLEPHRGSFGRLTTLLAEELQTTLPIVSASTIKERRVVQRELLRDYLTSLDVADLAEDVLQEAEVAPGEMIARARARLRDGDPEIRLMAESSRGGVLSLLVLAAACGGLLLELPFVCCRVERVGSRGVPRNLLFWALALAALAVAMALFGSAYDSICQPGGLRIGGEKPLLTPLQQAVFCAAYLSAVWFSLRLHFRANPGFFRGLLVSLCFLYVGVVSVTGYLRCQVVEAFS